ncbi:MAG: glycosyltransferase [Flavobacteriales bacterium]|nr:glycosyltransferase [Flavobacteriales bacterium]
MRVLRIINRFNLGGPTFNAAYLSRYLPDEFDTMLVGGKKDYTEDNSLHIIDRLQLEPIIIPEMKRDVNLINDYKAYRKICELIEEFKPDIIHSHASKAGALGRLAGKNLHVPHMVHTFHGHVFHSYFGRLTTSVYKSVERYMAKNSSRIIAISEKQKHELVDIYKIAEADKVTVVNLGFELDRFQTDFERKRKDFREFYQLSDDTVAIGIVGRLVPIKNHEMFIRAVRYIIDNSHQKVRAFIIGDGELRPELEELARRLEIPFNDPEIDEDDQLTFTSWMKDIDTANAGIDIAALSSKNEGTPVSLIEAQAANRPIVSTDVGGIQDIVLPGETAVLCPPNDQDAFNESLLRLVDDADYRLRLGEKGWDFVKDRFHYSRLVDDITQLYHSLD